MNITVYLGSNEGNDPALKTAVRQLGGWIGENGHTLVYGGSKRGLMGELAESVLMAGGKVIGVEPQFFLDMGFDYDAITQLSLHFRAEREPWKRSRRSCQRSCLAIFTRPASYTT